MFEVDFFSDAGSRPDNQDALRFSTILSDMGFVACIGDGVGGRNCGSFASTYAVETFVKAITDGAVDTSRLLIEINDHLIKKTIESPECKGMATTLTACVLRNNKIHVTHIGDSRVCVLRGNGIKQLTEDHTEVNRLLQSGALSKDAAKTYPRSNILDRALGMPMNKVKPQELTFDMETGDRVILSTDGLHNKVTKRELRDISLDSSSVSEFCFKIKTLVLQKHPGDNFSMIAIFIS